MIAVVCHDAGGAEILSSWLRRAEEPYCLVLEGPAKEIFERKLGNCHTVPLSTAIGKSDWVLCGSSWQSNLERQAISLAKVDGKKVAVFLDHWVHYQDRFLDKGVYVLPDEIWVGDDEAKKIAENCFQDLPVILCPNPYFEDLQRELRNIAGSMRVPGICSILYVCEPVAEHAFHVYGDANYWGYTEEEALRFFLENTDALGCEMASIKVRPHPSEKRVKYEWAKQATNLPLTIGGDKTLLEEIVAADIVVGCASMAMVVGLLAHKRVISSISPGGIECSLPFPEIEHLQVLVAKHQRSVHV